MKPAQRFSLIVLLILVAIFVVAYLYLDTALETLTRQMIGFITDNLSSEEVGIKGWEFTRLSISFPSIISLRECSAILTIPKRNALSIENNFIVTAKNAYVSVINIPDGEFAFNLSHAVVLMRPEPVSKYETLKNTDRRNMLEIVHLRLPFRINIFDLKWTYSQLKRLFIGFAKFVKDGVTDISMDLSGESTFVVGNKMVTGKLLLAPYGTDKKFVMDENDFSTISDILEEKLTREEFAVYCNNPVRMPRMLEIRNYAKEKSEEYGRGDARVPTEAYKHILWAYLLTVTYDEAFSKETTDAHEVNVIGKSELQVRTYVTASMKGREIAKPDSSIKTVGEIQMDLMNNATGRRYAQSGYTEDSLLERAMSDPKVVRHADELEKVISRYYETN